MFRIEQTKSGFAVWSDDDQGDIFMEGPGLFSWRRNSKGVTITGYKGSYPEIFIPDLIDGKPVTKIGSGAFRACETLKRVVLPESVTDIGQAAFMDCGSLTEITIPRGVTVIRAYTFSCCNSLKRVLLPESVTGIDVMAFNKCRSLTDISIPPGLTSIGSYAFSDCVSLRRVELPGSLKTIGNFAFDGCGSLTDVTIPRGLIKIGTAAFSNCASLGVISVSKDNPVFRSEDGCLYSKDYTELLHCPVGKTGTMSIRKGVACLKWGIFMDCGGLTEIRIPDSVKRIESYVFHGCGSLKDITIPDSVTFIGYGVFEGCDLLTRVVIPRGAAVVDAGAFQGCNNLNAIEAVDENPIFSSADGLLYKKDYSGLVCCPPGKRGSVRIPSGVKEICHLAFKNCRWITRVEIPDSVTKVSWNSFHDCSSLTEVRASEWLKAYFADSFKNSPWFKNQGWTEAGSYSYTTWILQEDDTLRIVCDGKMGDYDMPKILDGWKEVKDRVRRLNVDDGVKSVGNFAFDGFQNMTEAVLPDSVTRIGFRAFSRCRRLKQIVIPDSVTEIDTAAFKGCNAFEKIVIPEGVSVIGHSAFAYCSGLVSVTLTNSRVRILSHAFKGCDNLEEICCIGKEEDWKDLMKDVTNDPDMFWDAKIRFVEDGES